MQNGAFVDSTVVLLVSDSEAAPSEVKPFRQNEAETAVSTPKSAMREWVDLLVNVHVPSPARVLCDYQNRHLPDLRGLQSRHRPDLRGHQTRLRDQKTLHHDLHAHQAPPP